RMSDASFEDSRTATNKIQKNPKKKERGSETPSDVPEQKQLCEGVWKTEEFPDLEAFNAAQHVNYNPNPKNDAPGNTSTAPPASPV
ncbi:hypothetical protein PMAYCL1PPCAC_13179, partial [Pristionchus mayeri]